MIRIPTRRAPTHPGEMLEEEFLKPMNITHQRLANSVHLSLESVEKIIDGRAGMTPSSALRLAKYFGTTADFWMSLQLRWDLYHAQQLESEALASIELCHAAQAS